MTSIVAIEIINSVLLQVKHIIERKSDDFVILTTRLDNEQTLLKLGFTPRHAEEEICKLTYQDYVSGPEDNISKGGKPTGFIWVFGKQIQQLEIYIKFHIVQSKHHSNCVVISFHEAKFPLVYPLK